MADQNKTFVFSDIEIILVKETWKNSAVLENWQNSCRYANDGFAQYLQATCFCMNRDFPKNAAIAKFQQRYFRQV